MKRSVPTNRVPRALADRCAVCGRALSKPGRAIPGIGAVGPECARKFAGMEAFLEAAGAEELIHGVLELSEGAPPERVREVHALILRLRRARIKWQEREFGALKEA